jgi:hypothetical protein
MVPPNRENLPSKLMMKILLSKISWPTMLLCLLLFTLPIPGVAQEMALDRPLVASGISPMPEQDSADARKLALEEALRTAVEQSLAWLLPAERIVRFYPLLLNRILTEPMGYVQDYQIIYEGEAFGLYRVTVQTTLYSEGLTRDLRRLGLFLSTSERPRVTIFVAERTNPEDSWQWWWQAPPSEQHGSIFTQALIELISARGLLPLDSTLFLESMPDDPIYQEPLLDDAQGAALAAALGAQVAVLGQVSYRPASAGVPGMASGSLRAVKTDSGEILARVSATVQAQPSSEPTVADYGFTALAERLVPHLVDGVLAPFVAGTRAPHEITLQVLGVRSYSDLILIKEHLQRAPEVKEIRQIQLKADLGSFGLVLAGNLDDLRSTFADRDFGSFTTSADLTSENLITLTIRRKR